MKPELYSENPVKMFVRQEADYEAAGLDPKRALVMPCTADDNQETLVAKGVNWAGLMRQINQVYQENIGNNYAAKARAAFANGTTPPGQAELDEMVARYDFSGARVSTETGMPEEERVFRAILRSRLKDLLREGVFSEDQETRLTVQTQKEAAKEELLAGKISIADFEVLVEASAESVVFEYEDRPYDFSGDPEFEYDDEGNITSYINLAAVRDHSRQLAEIKLASDRAVRSVKASIPAAA